MASMAGKARRARRKRERTMGAACAWGVAATFGAGFIAFLALILTPNTALNQLAQLYANHIPISSNSEILQGIDGTIRPEDVFISALSLFLGGLTFGRLAPLKKTRMAVLRAGFGLSAAIVLGIVAFLVVFSLYVQGVQTSQIGLRVVVSETLVSLAWMAMGVLGTGIGVRWRDASQTKTV